MSSTKKWHFRLRDILDAIDKIQRYTADAATRSAPSCGITNG
jgi:uncharacterized protein with HEPN domain